MPPSLDAVKDRMIFDNPGFDWAKSGFEIVYKNWKSHVKDANVETLPTFCRHFMGGYGKRPSVRTSKKPGTTPDSVIDTLLKSRVPKLTNADLKILEFGHRLSMSAENILGLVLEEYVHEQMIGRDWSCVWGNSIPAVDFCSRDGKLLQIKNRSNTENSSSNKIRVGTKIDKWFRVDARTGNTYWAGLNRILGVGADYLSETKFSDFAKKLIEENPSALYLDEQESSRLLKKK